MKSRDFKFYMLPNGRCPVEEFLLKLFKKSIRDYVAIRARMDRAEAGNFGNYRKLGVRTIELKIPQGPGYRIYCVLTEDSIIAVHGWDKGNP